MRIARCPVCGFGIHKRNIRRGTFPCPRCGEPLRIARPGKFLGVFFATCGWSLAVLLGYAFHLQGNGFLLAVIVLGAPLSFGVAAVIGAMRGFLFPALERDHGNEGEIWHVVPRGWRKP